MTDLIGLALWVGYVIACTKLVDLLWYMQIKLHNYAMKLKAETDEPN